MTHIRLAAVSLVKKVNGELAFGRMQYVEVFDMTYFDDKLDVTSEKEWAKFIIEYRKFGKKLPIDDDLGNRLMYCITIMGAPKHVTEACGMTSPMFYLFPRALRMDKSTNKTEPILTYNRKYIWPYLK